MLQSLVGAGTNNILLMFDHIDQNKEAWHHKREPGCAMICRYG